MAKCISDEKNAVSYCLQELRQKHGYMWNNLTYVNNNRYCIVHGKPKSAIIFKRSWYETFGHMNFINETTGMKETGVGETLNIQELREFISLGVQILYFVHQEGFIYSIDMDKFLIQSHRWVNKESKEVRSISVHYLTRVNPSYRNIAKAYNGE